MINRTSLGSALPLLLVLQWGCASTKPAPERPAPPEPAPVVAAVTTEVVSIPEGLSVAYSDKELGKAPLELTIPSLDDVVSISFSDGDLVLVERRIKILGPNRIRVILRSGAPSPVAEALGLAKIVVFDYGDRATFGVNRWELNPDLHPMLVRQAEILKQHFSDVDVYICGHTDSTGAEAYNLKLSLRRAQSVADFLVERGLKRDRLKVQALGEAYPLASNDTPEGRGLNRRTEILLSQ